ncbi:hypothetical protein Hanom_Chr03g00180001 [Helianthus anomalus]
MSSSSSIVLRSKEKMVKTQPSDIICPCGGQTVYKQLETKANPGRWYLRCIGGCGFLKRADVGEEQGCPICREVMPALIQSIKDKDELAKCKDQLAQYMNDDVFKWKIYLGITWVLIPECNPEAIAENEKENDKDEDVITAEELDSYQQTENEKTFENPTKDYDPEVLEHAWDYTYWDAEDEWYHNPYEGEHGSDSDWSCLDDCDWK